MVYVISEDGHPLMPTTRYGKVRRMLKTNKASVVRRCPFTIQLLYEAEENTQELTLGADAGSKTVGMSVSSEKREYYSSEVQLRTDIVELLSARRELRRARRNRKTRYRAARFDNRVHSKQKGWLAPSVEEKVGTHLKVIADVAKILPLTKMVVETAQFDTQLLKAQEKGLPLPEGTGYQQGAQLGFWNTREYVLFRDDHICRCCKGKSKDKILNVHHIESRKTGGDSPDNLVTLCEYCHTQYHKGKVKLPETIQRQSKSLRDASFMGIMRWTLYNRLKEIYPDVHMTYGYITKNTRIRAGLPKEHRVDALCIAGHPNAVPADEWFSMRKVRCHNRQIHKAAILKGGIRKKNQAPYDVRGFHLFDKVDQAGKEYFVFGRRMSGFFDIRTLSGEKVNKGSVSCKTLRKVESAKHMLTERRRRIPPRPIEDGVSCADD